MMTISFEKLESANTLPPALFAIESSGFEATEVTDVYNKKIRELTAGLPKVATVPGEIIQYAR
jgi:hypothetical protein